MMHTSTPPTLPHNLGAGLLLRRATPADAETLATFNAATHRVEGSNEPNQQVATWTRDLMCGSHPSFAAEDFLLVEDTNTGAIVSSTNLISQTWLYGDVPINVGRPELVGTHPDYRRRGLVRAQFDVLHAWSAERGEQLQAITGIPWYYRQFGYEMALELGAGRVGYAPHVPTLKQGTSEPYHIRPATSRDLDFIATRYNQAMRRYALSCVRNHALWQYDIKGRSDGSLTEYKLRVIETPSGRPIGFMAHAARLAGPTLGVQMYELEPGVSWLAVTPSVVRYLQATGQQYAEQRQNEPWGAFAFWLGTQHPVYQVLHSRLPRTQPSYAWYIRVPDLLGFVRHITPVLETRLAQSVAVGHSGELLLSFYRTGMRLVFEGGHIAQVEPWQPTPEQGGNAAFPDHTFLQLLFGYHSLSELREAFADCWADEEAYVLLTALFPKQPSLVWPVE
jgi:hypothetical protein